MLGFTHTTCSLWSNSNFSHYSLCITFLTQSCCLVFYSFCVNLMHSFIISFIIVSISPHNLHLFFAAFCLFLFWYSWSVLHCFVLLSMKIHFFSFGFLFLAMSKFCRVGFRLFVTWNVHIIIIIIIIIIIAIVPAFVVRTHARTHAHTHSPPSLSLSLSYTHAHLLTNMR